MTAMPPPSTMRSRSITRASTQIGRPGGMPKTVTPPISMPVISRVVPTGRTTPCASPVGRARPGSRRAGWREHDTGGVARRIALADDEDRVRRVVGREAVGGAERRRVGEGRVARRTARSRRRADRARPRAARGRPGRGRHRLPWRKRTTRTNAHRHGRDVGPGTIERDDRAIDDPAPHCPARYRRLSRALRLAPRDRP